MGPRSRSIVAATLLLLVPAPAHLPALDGGLIWDDVDVYIVDNPLNRKSDGLWRIWFTTEPVDFIPTTYTTFWLEWRLWGDDPAGYHVVNLGLHAVAGILVWRVLVHLGVEGAWLAALVFLVHPVNVEAVAWISQRKTLLATTGCLAALLASLRREEGRGGAVAPLAWFFLAATSKPSVLLFPLAWLTCRWWQNGRISRRDLARSVGFFLIALVVGLIALWFTRNRSLGGETIRTIGVPSRLAGAAWAVWFYLGKAIFPHPVMFVYPRGFQSDAAGAWLPLVTLVGSLGLAWRFRRTWGRHMLGPLAWFILMLVPALGFVDFYFLRYSLVGDHYQYQSLPAVVALGVAAASVHTRAWPIALRCALAASLVASLGLVSFRHAAQFRDAETLWRHTIAQNPSASLAYNNLGRILYDRGERRQAEQLYRQSIQLDPVNHEAINNIGVALIDRGRLDEAQAVLERGVMMAPDFSPLHSNLATAAVRARDTSRALVHVREVCRIEPHNVQAHINLGGLLEELGHMEGAVHAYETALGIDPSRVWLRARIAELLDRSGQGDAAYRLLVQGALADPTSAPARAALAAFLAERGRWGQAEEAFRVAVAIDPDHPSSHGGLGGVLFHQGKWKEADEHLRRALALDPNNFEAHINLGILCDQQNRLPEAIEHFREAVRVMPRAAVAHRNLALAAKKAGDKDLAARHFLQAAWLLATHEDPSERNGREAVRLALDACPGGQSQEPFALDVLAAAYAETNQFDDAVRTARAALAIAEQSDARLAQEIRHRLALYSSGRAYHAAPP